MNILIVGSGGREHSIAWKLAQSSKVTSLFIAPGNAGTASLGTNIEIHVDHIQKLVEFALANSIDFVVVGPEVALAAGIVDAFQKVNIRAFGPTQNAAMLESSKSFAKDFMVRHGIPSARYKKFNEYEQAITYINEIDYPIVIKASGLAAGKGVILPETKEEACLAISSLLREREFGDAGDEIIIEERLVGEEVSVLAFTDGKTIIPMPPAQDHKRLLDDDMGPNTGGMGAYAPTPLCDDALLEKIKNTVLVPVIEGMKREGKFYQGVLYAGLMITTDGPKVLEFNCRFGDPETQVILPLLDSDLLEIFLACVDGNLDQLSVHWKTGAAATVVLASGGYPGKYSTGHIIKNTNPECNTLIVFHAGTQVDHGEFVTAGGRVMNVTGIGTSLSQAIKRAYQAIGRISFKDMIYRTDIGQKAFRSSITANRKGKSYQASGVDIDAGNRAVRLMKDAVRSTYTPAVLAGIGSFGGLFDGSSLNQIPEPVLVASTDGVGTKVHLATLTNRYESIGEDIVNHCINDILVQGASPLFFLDYFACSKLNPEVVARVVAGISSACCESGCVLIGGETAEMPGVYMPGEFDLAGTIVGIVKKQSILPRKDLQPGDLLVGFSSSGPHTNGYSLIRRVYENTPLDQKLPGEEHSRIDMLMAPHKSYLPVLKNILESQPALIKGLAHITGGGFIENIPRILPDGISAIIDKKTWMVPPIFREIQHLGNIKDDEMFRVFNMGIGMVAVIAPEDLNRFQGLIQEEIWMIGHLIEGHQGVVLV